MWRGVIKWVGALALLGVLCAAAGVYWWPQQPLALALPERQDVLEVQIPPKSSVRGVVRALRQDGVQAPETLLYFWLLFSGRSGSIKPGTYALKPGITPPELLDKLARGDQIRYRVTLIEGWNIRQVQRALRQAPHLRFDLPDDPQQWLAAIDRPAGHPEGRFFPDTYLYTQGGNASAILRQAAAAMDKRLQAAWEQRQPGLPLQTPEQALILASIIEKETGHPGDRAQIAAVFVNRLRIGMRLQTDPTVIYGLGARFDGNLRKTDLQTDTPYNSYTRAGLPPTPIAMPGAAALKAAVQPAPDTKALYFVARGDGTSHFSATLEEHNAAVQRYILRR
ncbi:endolytic transglycosylase MltG [Macromonas bipunctata]|uniref:endolytic transglycosylase MltG n=1 Tax=Macromonas bipunctata TaxID=183670 RepID=UPI003B82DD75